MASAVYIQPVFALPACCILFDIISYLVPSVEVHILVQLSPVSGVWFCSAVSSLPVNVSSKKAIYSPAPCLSRTTSCPCLIITLSHLGMRVVVVVEEVELEEEVEEEVELVELDEDVDVVVSIVLLSLSCPPD